MPAFIMEISEKIITILSRKRRRLICFLIIWVLIDIAGAVIIFQFDDIGAPIWGFLGIVFIPVAAFLWGVIDALAFPPTCRVKLTLFFQLFTTAFAFYIACVFSGCFLLPYVIGASHG